jgi:hypothetical protein
VPWSLRRTRLAVKVSHLRCVVWLQNFHERAHRPPLNIPASLQAILADFVRWVVEERERPTLPADGLLDFLSPFVLIVGMGGGGGSVLYIVMNTEQRKQADILYWSPQGHL